MKIQKKQMSIHIIIRDILMQSKEIVAYTAKQRYGCIHSKDTYTCTEQKKYRCVQKSDVCIQSTLRIQMHTHHSKETDACTAQQNSRCIQSTAK